MLLWKLESIRYYFSITRLPIRKILSVREKAIGESYRRELLSLKKCFEARFQLIDLKNQMANLLYTAL